MSRAMLRGGCAARWAAALLAAAFAATACGDSTNSPSDAADDGAGDGSTDARPDGMPDADCTDGSAGLVIQCPEDIDLGCVPAAGAPAEFAAAASSCGDPSPDVVCTPAAGASFAPGDTTVECVATASSGESASCEFTVHAVRDGGFDLVCTPGVTTACAGPATAVDVPAPTIDERCGTAVGAVMSDAPAGGVPGGTTTVTFSASGEAGFSTTCTTMVTVTDGAPPVLTCPPSVIAVRTDPAADAPAPVLEAADACQGVVPATASPATLPRGTYPVEYTATDASGNDATCTTTATVLDAFAPGWPRVASARLGSDGTTSIVVAWEPSTGADVQGYRVDRAAAPDGPWTALGLVDGATLVFTDPALPGTVAWYRVVALAGDLDGGATTPVRALSIAAAQYDLRGQSVPTVPFSTTLYGVVRHPVDWGLGPYPPVILLHGNHGNCRPTRTIGDDDCAETTDHDCHRAGYTTTPNAEGMAYLAETLAAHGYVATTISANALNCRDDYIPERVELILEHLRRWRDWSSVGGAPFGATFVGHVDMEHVGLVGHSRGGEAVALAPARLAATPIAGVAIGSVWSTAPTDYHGGSPSAVPYAVLVPGCDGDVPLGHGIAIYDRSLLPAGQPHSQVFFVAANHNYFSTEWRYDDNLLSLTCWSWDEIGARAQRGMLEATLAAWFDGTLAPGGELEPFLRADGETPLGIEAWANSDLDLRWSHAASVRTAIDDFSGAGAPAVNLLGRPNTFSGYSTSRSCSQNGCDTSFDHPHDAMFLSWDGGTPVASWDLGGLDATGAAGFSFRMVSRRSTLNDGIVEQLFLVRLVDGDGTTVEFPLTDVRRVPHLYTSNDVKEMLQTVRVPLPALAAFTPGFDLGGLGRFELEMTAAGHTRGSVLVTDLELAGN
ncbi:MAG: HYR domain-containing protein [Deltaproteobacteria bacterium]|nr:HYR domain-containing protein [Deltaproteobacteria bacterium]